MAEYIHYRSEAMVREFEEMRRINLFTQEEISAIKIRREQFEHKLRAKENYVNYIKYETQLLKLCRKRRDKFLIGEKKDAIEYSIVKRIKKLHSEVIRRFPDDVKLKYEHFTFCLQSKDAKACSVAITTLMKLHPNEEQVWHIATNWQLDEAKNVNGALNVLYKGLQHHKASKELHYKCFRIILDVGKKIVDDAVEFLKEEEMESGGKLMVSEKQEKQVAEAKVVFDFAAKTIKDVNFYIALLDIAKEFEFTASLQEYIRNYLTENFQNSENTWNYLAKEELSSEHSDDNISKCVRKYKEALTEIPTRKMWSYYLDTLSELHSDKPEFTAPYLLEALQEGDESNQLEEKHYMKWVQLTPEELPTVLRRGLEALPKSLELHKSLIRYLILTDWNGNNRKAINDVFESSVKHLKEASLPIWEVYLKYCKSLPDTEPLKKLFARAVHEPELISQKFKPAYIEWTEENLGRKHSRAIYLELAPRKPYCKELHEKMLQIENLEENSSTNTLKACETAHKLACDQFGSECTKVWLDYLKFDLKWKKGLNSCQIRNEAMRNLANELHDVFQVEYLSNVNDEV